MRIYHHFLSSYFCLKVYIFFYIPVIIYFCTFSNYLDLFLFCFITWISPLSIKKYLAYLKQHLLFRIVAFQQEHTHTHTQLFDIKTHPHSFHTTTQTQAITVCRWVLRWWSKEIWFYTVLKKTCIVWTVLWNHKGFDNHLEKECYSHF